MDERVEKWLYDIRFAIEEIDSYIGNCGKSLADFQQNLMLKRNLEIFRVKKQKRLEWNNKSLFLLRKRQFTQLLNIIQIRIMILIQPVFSNHHQHVFERDHVVA